MSKSVLILDTPDKCEDCYLCHNDVCKVLDLVVKREKHKDCPLRELPSKEQCNYYNFENFNTGRQRGWNDFYDMITTGELGKYS